MTFYYLPSWRSIQEKRCAALKSGVCKDVYFTLQLVTHRNNADDITMSSYVSSISSNLVFYHFLCTSKYISKYNIMAAKTLLMISICNRFQPCKMIILKGSFTMFLAIKIDLVSFLTNFITDTHGKKILVSQLQAHTC